MIVQSKRDKFLETYIRKQPWTISDSVIYYISKNPSTAKVYEKLINSCKHFFIKHPMLLVSQLGTYDFDDDKRLTKFNGKVMDLKNVWINDEIEMKNISENRNNQYFVSSVLPRLYRSDAKIFHCENQNISFNHFKFLASKCKIIFLWKTVVINEDGTAAAIEKIVEAFPNVKEFDYCFGDNSITTATSKTVQELIKISHFSNLHKFALYGIPEAFDINSIYDYIKKNKKTKFVLHYSDPLSEAYKTLFQKIVYEIIATENRNYKTPFISFPDIHIFSRINLWNLYAKG